MCCQNGKVLLADLLPLPVELDALYQDSGFMKSIRAYNQAFAFTSFGARIPDMPGIGPPSFRIQGQVSHLIGSLLPVLGEAPAFAQLYFFDTDYENELTARSLKAYSQIF
jgi:hypothetical protein